MASKQVTDREKVTRAIVAAVETHAQEIAAGIQEVLGPYVREGETLPDVAFLVTLAGRWQTGTTDELQESDKAHELELGDDLGPRQARDMANELVRRELIDVRTTVETHYGEVGLKRLGLDGQVPTDPSVVATTAKRVVAALLDPRIELPPPRRRSITVDRAVLASEIREALPALERSLADVAREAREAETTLARKRTAMERSDRATVRGGAWLAATCALAGRDDLAAKLRPTNARRSSAGEGETPPDGGGPTEGTGATSPAGNPAQS
jgi:hypothetical protein